LWAWDVICVCADTGERRKNDAVLQVHVSYPDREEESGGWGI
jgi:hypothetical protein